VECARYSPSHAPTPAKNVEVASSAQAQQSFAANKQSQSVGHCTGLACQAPYTARSADWRYACVTKTQQWHPPASHGGVGVFIKRPPNVPCPTISMVPCQAPTKLATGQIRLQEAERLYLALCKDLGSGPPSCSSPCANRRALSPKQCACGHSAIAITKESCPNCGENRCAYCEITKSTRRPAGAKRLVPRCGCKGSLRGWCE
jgi:hypothetical protein